MYVCAQRVHATAGPHSGSQGINSFIYLHGPYTWQDLPENLWPEKNPGVFTDSLIEVPPPGNRVRSYLDIVAPDGTTIHKLVHVAGNLTAVPQIPWTWSEGSVWCRFGVESALASEWQHELHRLLARVVLLLRRQTPA